MSAVLEKKLVIVGLGRAAGAYLEVLPELPELYLSAVVEPDDDKAERVVREFGAHHFHSVDAMIDAGLRPDIALVCSPPGDHDEATEALVRAGIDVMVEPPLSILPEDADRLETTAERLGRVVTTASRYATFDAVRVARSALADDKIGRLCFLEIALSTKLDPRASWRSEPERSGGGVWMELGPHAIDLAETLAGPVQRIRMKSEERIQSTEVEDEVLVELEHGGGVGTRIALSWNHLLSAPIVRCVGDRGELIVGWAQSVWRDSHGEEHVISGCYDRGAATRGLLDAFLLLRRQPEPAIDPGAQTLAWIHAGYRSLAEHRWEIA